MFADFERQRAPDLSAEALAGIAAKALRAPMILVAIISPQDHPKVPYQEQVLATGAATYAISLAADALGYGSIWRTGGWAFSESVQRGLQLQEQESIAGFLYIGTPAAEPKNLPAETLDDYLHTWP